MALSPFETRYNKSFISLLGYVSLVLFSTLIGALFIHAGGREVTMPVLTATATAPSFGGLLAVTFIPLVLTFLLVRWNRKILLRLLVVMKTAIFSFSFYAVIAAFPNAGWLVLFLILFSGWFGICVYHWLWMQILVFQSRFTRRSFLICGSILLLVVLFDYLLIYPFAASLFIH